MLHCQVPYLIYGGKTLQPDEAPSPDAVKVPESLVILEFLADVFPNSGLLPADPALRARARLFYQAVDSKFLPAFFAFFFLKAPLDALLGALQGMQSLLPEEGFAVGEWSIADATFTPLLMRLNLFLTVSPFTLKEEVIKQAVEALRSPRFARLQKYLEDNMARPSMAKTWDEVSKQDHSALEYRVPDDNLMILLGRRQNRSQPASGQVQADWKDQQ